MLSKAARQRYRLWLLSNAAWVCVLTILAAAAASSAAQAPQTAPGQPAVVVDRITFDGNRRIRAETLLSRIFTRGGDPYNEDGLRRDFQALWNTQYFEDIRLEVQDSPTRPNAKIVIFHVIERPVIRRIEYHGLKSVTQSDVLDKFKDRKVGLTVEGQFDPTKIKKAEVVIKDLLAEHGRQFAVVKPTYERIPATNAVKLIFSVEEGPKVKVGTITFQGNHAFSNRRILRSMKNSRPYSIPLYLFDLPVMSKTFDRDKLDQDLEIGVRALYQDNGYYHVVVKDPILKTVDVTEGQLPHVVPLVGRHPGKATQIVIPIDEGAQYRMGTLVIRSSDPDKPLTIKREYLESIFPIKQGQIFSTGKVRKAIEDYTKLYGVGGFIDFTATPETEVHDDTKTVDLTFNFDEQKRFFVRRIDFSGNLTTRDKVIRREVLLNEGDVFNNHLWEVSLLRLNQLGYFERIKMDDATINRNQAAGTVDILLKVKEKGKQSISLTGGVSGITGGFVGLTYQTNNFLGLGETLTFSTQFGQLQRSFLFGFTQPYLFDRPISTGFTLSYNRYTFNQSQQYSLLIGQKVQLNPNFEQDYNEDSRGFTTFVSYPLRKFSFARLGLTYGYTYTSISSLSTASTLLFEDLNFQSLAGPSALSGIRSSRLTPTFTYNTVNDPINPTTGKGLSYSFSWEGAGGNVRTISNVLDMKYFRPSYHKRNVIALHFLTSFATGYQGKELPPFERLYLGGETDLRGFDIRTVTPVAFIPVASTTTFSYIDPRILPRGGQVNVSIPTLNYQIAFPGGDTEGVLNSEYRIPIAGPVSMSLFNDFGTVGVLNRNQLQISDAGYSAILSSLNATANPSFALPSKTLGLEPGTNFRLRDSMGIEFVVQLPIVNAPFRLYYAFNALRFSNQIIAPTSQFNLSSVTGQNIPPEQIPNVNALIQNLQSNPQRINFFEPRSTFRFTISRTF